MTSDAQIQRAVDLLARAAVHQRRSSRALRKAQRRRRAQRFLRFSTIGLAILIACWIAAGFIFGPPGVFGIILFPATAMLTLMVALLLSREAPIAPASLANTDPVQMTARAALWLEQQRPALPMPAQRLCDDIGLQLAQLGNQLGRAEPDSPAVTELRRLIADDMPDLVTRYRQLPDNMRRADRNGRTADSELTAGLRLIDQQITQLTHDVTAADLDQLATRKRYLELRYQDDG